MAVCNASPLVADVSTGCYAPDLAHIAAQLARYSPDVVLACGKMAQRGLAELDIPYVPAPHPAWRQLTKAHCAEIKQHLISKTGHEL